ncbi:MAG: asparagine synthase (glutamine-hydrolyzing) [Pseudomonadota bacterium]
MCGLAGAVALDSTWEPERLHKVVRQMCAVIEHRGPDDSGIVQRNSVCLGSQRLSIIDLSLAGHMPMTEPSGRWCIAYNGEVYNHEEIREELTELGHQFRSRTDTEVVLHAFMEWGVDALQRFVGMFAFAIYDSETEIVTLARDRYGIKPLYYLQTGHIVAFASEIKALLPAQDTLSVNSWRLLEWSLYRNIDTLSRSSILEGVINILPGEIVEIQGEKISHHTYYSPLDHVSEESFQRHSGLSSDKLVDDFDRVFTDAVHKRMMSDVPVGTLLSGGLDSNLTTAVAAQKSRELSAFHVSIKGFPKLDERAHAEGLARHLSIPFIPLEFDGKLFRQSLAKVSYLSDVPITHPNSVAYYLICQIARQHGVIVLLSGEGADELFGGYRFSYRRMLWLMKTARIRALVPSAVRDMLALLVYDQEGLPVSSYRFRETLPATIAITDKFSRQAWRDECARSYSFVRNPRDRVVLGTMLSDLADFLTPLLRRLDRMSMGNSVECRVPFLDHRLVHKAINLPLSHKVGSYSNKWALRQVAHRYMPKEFAQRRKMGFPLPLMNYIAPLAQPEFFRSGFCEQVLELRSVGIESALKDWNNRVHAVFGLLAMELWGRQFVLGQSLEMVEAHIAKFEPAA